MKRIVMASLLAFLTTSTADAWEFYVIEGRGAGTLNACAATQIYRDAFFTVRLYAEEMDVEPEAADAWIEQMNKDNRYVRDLPPLAELVTLNAAPW